MNALTVAIENPRPMPSDYGEFYPSTGLMDEARMLIGDDSYAAKVLIRDLMEVIRDFKEIFGDMDDSMKTLIAQSYEETRQALMKDLETWVIIYKTHFGEFYGNIQCRPPMNPIEEINGMLTILEGSCDFEIRRTAREDRFLVDKLNDRFWTAVDGAEDTLYRQGGVC